MYQLLLTRFGDVDAVIPTDAIVGWVILLLFTGIIIFLCFLGEQVADHYRDEDALGYTNTYTDADTEHIGDVVIYNNDIRVIGGFLAIADAIKYLEIEVGSFNAGQHDKYDDERGLLYREHQIGRVIGNSYVVETWIVTEDDTTKSGSVEYRITT